MSPSPPPVTVFSATVDPAGALQALRASGAEVTVTRADGGDWREATATFGPGQTLTASHDPGYYAEASWARQLPGMFGYFLRARGGPPETDLLATLRAFRFALTLQSAEWDPVRQAAAERVAAALDGVLFLPGMLLDAAGRTLFSVDGEADPEAELPRPAPPHPLLLPRGGLYDRQQPPPGQTRAPRRAASCGHLAARGFAAAYWLPEHPSVQLRPALETARRLAALRVLFLWVTRLDLEEGPLRAALDRDGLREALTDEEREAFEGPRTRANAERSGTVGWRLENLWALAWALGYQPTPSVDTGMVEGAALRALLDFCPATGAPLEPWLAQRTPRPVDAVADLEDLFYLAHHAVRSAQQGKVTVPPDFHPLRDGGCLHERRHALTWLLSPDTAWEDTDLST